MQLEFEFIVHEIEHAIIHQRAVDGFVNATAMCKASGKQFNDYVRIGPTKEFLTELSSVTGIPVSELVISLKGGTRELQGTWVHPDVSINLGQWCSPKFAVAVSQWVREWLRDSKGIDTDALPTYRHLYGDGRVVFPKLYPNEVLADFRKHFHTVWLPRKAAQYFAERDQKALQYLPKLIPAPKK